MKPIPLKRNEHPKRSSIYSIAAVVLPIVIIAIGILLSFSTDATYQGYDWIGVTRIKNSINTILVAATTSIILAAIAYLRKEEEKWMSTLTAVPAIFILFITGVFFIIGAD
ncbi:MAG: hypothetical protein ACSHX8_03085 [Opitutaceae bacterium]